MGGDDLADLYAFTVSSLARQGLSDAERIAEALIQDLRRQLAGNSIYIDRGFAERDAQIRREFNGRNSAKLATQYALTKRRIEQILAAG